MSQEILRRTYTTSIAKDYFNFQSCFICLIHLWIFFKQWQIRWYECFTWRNIGNGFSRKNWRNTSKSKPNDDRDNSAGDSDSHEVTIKKRESKHGFTKSKSSSTAKSKSSYASKDDLNSLSAYRSGYHFISEVGALWFMIREISQAYSDYHNGRSRSNNDSD